MAIYKRRGQKKSIINKVEGLSEESTTAEVFDKLDSSASKTEQFVAKYQNYIIGFIGFITFTILSYLAYINFIYEIQMGKHYVINMDVIWAILVIITYLVVDDKYVVVGSQLTKIVRERKGREKKHQLFSSLLHHRC